MSSCQGNATYCNVSKKTGPVAQWKALGIPLSKASCLVLCFLQDLDLSYNNLSPEDIWVLGDLSQLKVLRLTANGLRSLPPDLAGSWG